MKGFNPNDITMLVRIAFGGAIVYSAVSLGRKIRPRTGEGSRDLDELWERYERGEISWDEYHMLAHALGERDQGSP